MDENLLTGKVILVVDDENDLRDIVASEFEFMGARVFQAENISVAKKVISENKIDLIVSDIRMPGGTGIDLLDHVKAIDVQAPPIVLITGFADITTENAFAKGAEGMINKPFKLDDLIQTAVRFTSEPIKRLTSEVETPAKTIRAQFNQTLDEKLASASLKLGRGGLTTVLDSSCMKCDLGESVNFEFKFSDKELKGIGTCRWMKPVEQNDGKFVIGLEFLKLDGESLELITKAGVNSVEFIPAHAN